MLQIVFADVISTIECFKKLTGNTVPLMIMVVK